MEKENKIEHKLKMYSYKDMLAAFISGKKHEKEYGMASSDCWDFSTWLKEHDDEETKT